MWSVAVDSRIWCSSINLDAKVVALAPTFRWKDASAEAGMQERSAARTLMRFASASYDLRSLPYSLELLWMCEMVVH